jgi:hypothetical protein
MVRLHPRPAVSVPSGEGLGDEENPGNIEHIWQKACQWMRSDEKHVFSADFCIISDKLAARLRGNCLDSIQSVSKNRA